MPRCRVKVPTGKQEQVFTVVRLFEVADGEADSLEKLYGETGRYTLLCRSFYGYRGDTLRWLRPSKRLYERVEHWQSDWARNVFRVIHRAEREAIAAEARKCVLQVRTLGEYYE